MHPEKQKKALVDYSTAIEGMLVVGKKTLMPFQRGILLTNNAMLKLYDKLQVKFPSWFQYVLTRRLNQDVVENSFAQIRGMGGNHTQPGPVDFRQRLRLYILGGCQVQYIKSANVEVEDEDEDEVIGARVASGHIDLIEGLAEIKGDEFGPDASSISSAPISSNSNNNNPNNNDTDTDTDTDKDTTTDSDNDDNQTPTADANKSPAEIARNEGLNHLAGFLVRAAREPGLYKINNNIENDKEYVHSQWLDSINTGGLAYPAKEVVQDVEKMEAIFEDFHRDGEFGLKRGTGVVESLFQTMKPAFPQYSDAVLRKYCFTRTMIRLRRAKNDLRGGLVSTRTILKRVHYSR